VKGRVKLSHEKAKLLTICIPTFNRKETVLATLNRLTSLRGFGEDFDVLVSDNNSPDGTFSEIASLFSATENLIVNKQNENVGFAGNFFWLLHNCHGNFAIFLSDEDDIAQDGLDRTLEYLRGTTDHFCSPIAEMHFDGWPGRGRSKKSRIDTGDVSAATFYISGLVFRSKTARRYTQVLSSLSKANEFVRYYPQSALLASILIEGRHDAHFIPYRVTSQRIVIEGELPYTSLESRSKQFEDAVSFATSLKTGQDYLSAKFVANERRILNSVKWRQGDRRVKNFWAWLEISILALKGRIPFFFEFKLLSKRIDFFLRRGH